MDAPLSHVRHPLNFTTTKQKTFAYLQEKKNREEFYHKVYMPKMIEKQKMREEWLNNISILKQELQDKERKNKQFYI